jgi:hypothetical protein
VRNCQIRVSRATCVVVCLTALGLSASEKKIQRSDLPPGVEKTVVELIIDGRSKDVLMDKGGEVVEVEEQVAITELPSAVRDGLQAKAGKGKLTKVESIRKHDRLVAYEAQVLNGATHSEVQVGPDGKPLDHEE